MLGIDPAKCELERLPFRAFHLENEEVGPLGEKNIEVIGTSRTNVELGCTLKVVFEANGVCGGR
jgi:hypothetical protein